MPSMPKQEKGHKQDMIFGRGKQDINWTNRTSDSSAGKGAAKGPRGR